MGNRKVKSIGMQVSNGVVRWNHPNEKRDEMRSDNKTKVNDQNVIEFLGSLDNNRRREDSLKLLDIFEEVTEEDPKMWGDKIIGYGSYHYEYSSGRKGDWMLTGFSPGKQHLTLYIMSGFKAVSAHLGKLGKYRLGKSCLYINKLDDVDLEVLKDLIETSIGAVKNHEINYE